MATTHALATLESAPLDRRLSITQIKARRNAIIQLMRDVMKPGIDYGTIPGTAKPTLLKPGAEKICSMFQLSPRPQITSHHTEDVFTYEAYVELESMGAFCGTGVGVCSTDETRYKWRQATGPKEWAATPEDRRRIAYKRGNKGEEFEVFQVRTEMADYRNTALKMSKKRGLIDAVLTATDASDIFTQDIPPEEPEEDEPQPEEPEEPEEEITRPQAAKPAPQPVTSRPPSKPTPPQAPVISEAQAKRFWAIAKKAGKSDEEIRAYLLHTYKIDHTTKLKRQDYDDVCLWASGVTVPTQEEDLEPNTKDIW